MQRFKPPLLPEQIDHRILTVLAARQNAPGLYNLTPKEHAISSSYLVSFVVRTSMTLPKEIDGELKVVNVSLGQSVSRESVQSEITSLEDKGWIDVNKTTSSRMLTLSDAGKEGLKALDDKYPEAFSESLTDCRAPGRR